MDSHTQAVIDMVKEAVDICDLKVLSDMSLSDMTEVEMAAAIGRLTATLGMLIAAVDQPKTIS
jgi:hypothetical protein